LSQKSARTKVNIGSEYGPGGRGFKSKIKEGDMFFFKHNTDYMVSQARALRLKARCFGGPYINMWLPNISFSHP